MHYLTIRIEKITSAEGEAVADGASKVSVGNPHAAESED